MSPIEYLKLICEGSNGSVALAELTPLELLWLANPRLDGLVHTIAGLAIVTTEGWAAVA